jgi:hypothetical protein
MAAMNVAKMCMQHVWIFTGIEGRGFPGGVFLDRETAEEWIRKHRLWGTLTLYAVNVGNYEHASQRGRKPQGGGSLFCFLALSGSPTLPPAGRYLIDRGARTQ